MGDRLLKQRIFNVVYYVTDPQIIYLQWYRRIEIDIITARDIKSEYYYDTYNIIGP